MSEFAPAVRAAMAERGLSLRATAKAIAFDPGYVSRVLSGKRPPTPQMADALDTYLHADGALSALAAALTPDDRARVAHSFAAPSRTDEGTAHALADVLAAQRRLEDSIGAAAMLPGMLAQLDAVTPLARNARGPHVRPLLAVVAEMHQYAGWLFAALRQDRHALGMLARAKDMADGADAPTVAAVATSFRGYVARQQGRYPAVVRAAQAARHSPGAHVTQQVFDTLQAAQGHAEMGEADAARRLLDEAAHRVDEATDPPGIVYWYGPSFFALNIGMVHASLGGHADAADHLRAGLDGLPPEQRDAEWTREYRDALNKARAA
ncbi:helix-turn-helix domain-containing protein [Streptomonospora salina]|uniref:Transcriptional regulator with XRE-family HTH domain n=1 Tax=Streptomonospora salina TaxID=104205 RepID=A0A841E9F4_9ACTN|nr:helix-turn-helix transcriptional regulator [Streptomonospora salina]MBB5997713.1 transcriptional regulator with XRE-family HTH domain [Streptomonospora salina]